jgi:branched-chain amino acid transport system permease protein
MLGREFPLYRVAVVAVSVVVVGGLWLLFERTTIGARLRAAVDNSSMAGASGVNVPMLFRGTFALGSGLAALGGGLGAAMLPLEPNWPFRYLVPILIIVALTGHGNIRSVVGVSILFGVIDTAAKLLIPDYGAFPMYIALIALIVWRKDGLFVKNNA